MKKIVEMEKLMSKVEALREAGHQEEEERGTKNQKSNIRINNRLISKYDC